MVQQLTLSHHPNICVSIMYTSIMIQVEVGTLDEAVIHSTSNYHSIPTDINRVCFRRPLITVSQSASDAADH